MALDTLRSAFPPEEITMVTRVEDDNGNLKVTILRDRLEITGALMTEGVLHSFGLYYSVLSGRLSAIDVSLLRRNYPLLFWASWGEVASVVSTHLQECTREGFHLFVAEIKENPISFPNHDSPI